MEPATSPLRKIGNSRYIAIPRGILQSLAWRDGCTVAIRQAGSKIIIERVQLEKLAILLPSPAGSGQ